MWANTKTLILFAIQLGISNACADDDKQISAKLPTEQPSPNRVASRIDYLSNHFLVAREKSIDSESIPHGEPVEVANKNVPANDKPATGLHWVTGNHHPALEFRFSDQGTIRFHPNRHGGSVTAAWSF
jgi:hypothetical protein